MNLAPGSLKLSADQPHLCHKLELHVWPAGLHHFCAGVSVAGSEMRKRIDTSF